MFHLFFCPQIHHHMIAAVGLAQGIIEFCYLLLVLFPVGKLDPQFPRHLIEGDDFFADQLTRLVILRRHISHDKHFGIRLDQCGISFIISWKYNYFHRSHQIFQCDKCHNFIVFRIFDRFFCNHAADDHFRSISHLGQTALFHRIKVRGSCRDILFPDICILFQRMAADIHTKHLFFKCQLAFFRVLSHIRQADLKALFILFSHNIKQTHLTGHRRFFLLIDRIHHLHIDHHKLLSRSAKAVKGSRFDKVFNGPLIHFFSA